MEPNPADIKKKRKLQWWWFLFIPLLAFGAFVLMLFGPNPPIEIGPDTTYITEPLDENGLPDYAVYLIERGAKGVTEENNAAVSIWEATGFDSLDNHYQQALVDELGIQWPEQILEPTYGESIRANTLAWLEQKIPNFEGEQNEHNELLYAIIGDAMYRRWSPGELPFVDTWAATNSEIFRELQAGVARPKHFSPPPNFLVGEDSQLFMMLLPEVQNLREVGRGLNLTATWHITHGRNREAWQCLLCSYRVARHCDAENGFLVQSLVGMAIEQMNLQTMKTLLSVEVGSDLLAEIKSDLGQLPPRNPVANVLSESERLGALDAILALRSGNFEPGLFGGGAEILTATRGLRIDWNVALRATNVWYDRIAEASRLPYQERREALAALEMAVQDLSKQAESARIALGVFSTKARSQILADIMLSLSIPSVLSCTNAEDRSKIQWDALTIAIGLAQYKAAEGEYPQQLELLVPSYLQEVPADFYRDEPFVYKKTEDGYLLYSVFSNGKDDLGTSLEGDVVRGEYTSETNVDPNECDIVIRIPVPKFDLQALLDKHGVVGGSTGE